MTKKQLELEAACLFPSRAHYKSEAVARCAAVFLPWRAPSPSFPPSRRKQWRWCPGRRRRWRAPLMTRALLSEKKLVCAHGGGAAAVVVGRKDAIVCAVVVHGEAGGAGWPEGMNNCSCRCEWAPCVSCTRATRYVEASWIVRLVLVGPPAGGRSLCVFAAGGGTTARRAVPPPVGKDGFQAPAS